MCVCVCVCVCACLCVSECVCGCVHSLIGVYESIYFELLSGLSRVGLSSVSMCSGAITVIAITNLKKGGRGNLKSFNSNMCTGTATTFTVDVCMVYIHV